MAKILLIEDNEMIQVMTTRWLTRKGHDVRRASDGMEGIAMAHSEHPDVILMDMNMPLVDGWTATRELKSAADTRRIPIIGLSADAMVGDPEKGLEAGCDAYHTKPINFPALLADIELLIGRAAEPAG
ncbi:MAG TPA: response regulator [Chloroflexia bacterium]|nr:response regulator [Chloroflexia bacterium]